MPDYRALLTQLEGGLAIDEHRLDEHWVEHAELFYRVSKAHAMVISLRDEAKQELAEVEAGADVRIRVAMESNDERITEKVVESKRRLDPQVRRSMSSHNAYTLLVGQYAALKEAYLQRGYALKALVELYVNNYYGATDAPARQVRNTNADRARTAIARVRRERHAS